MLQILEREIQIQANLNLPHAIVKRVVHVLANKVTVRASFKSAVIAKHIWNTGKSISLP